MSRPPLQIRVTAANHLQDQYGEDLDLPDAAVNVDFDSGDVRGVVGREKSNGAGNFFGPADALHGNVRQEMLQHGVSCFLGEIQASEDRSFDGTGSDGVDTDVAADEFRSQGAGKGAQRCLCRGINGRSSVAFDSCNTSIEDDGAAVIEVRERFLDGVIRAFGVDVENFVVVSFVGIFEWPEFGDACVHEKNVDLAEFLRDCGIKAIEIGEFRHVGLDRKNSVADILHCFVESFLAAAGNRHFCAFVGKTFGGGQTDAAVTAGDDGNLTFKAFHKILQRICTAAGMRRDASLPVTSTLR